MDDFTPDEPPISPDEFLESISRLTRDLRSAAITLGEREARFLVDAYYAMQRDRIRAGHQNRTLLANEEPNIVLRWLQAQRDTLEKQIARALEAYSGGLLIGRWARSQVGIGPIIAAGLASHIDIKKAPTAGHIWRYAGLDPTMEWLGTEKAKVLVAEVLEPYGKTRAIHAEAVAEIARRLNTTPENFAKRMISPKGEPLAMNRDNLVSAVAKRPWNGGLKRLCFLIGESFVKVSGKEDAVYGRAYAVRKQRETTNNEAGLYADQAAHALATKNYGADTEARKHYEAGRLPPARIHLRAHRWATKLFLSNYHHVAYEIEFGKPPPLPYILAKDPVLHTDFMAPPNWPMED